MAERGRMRNWGSVENDVVVGVVGVHGTLASLRQRPGRQETQPTRRETVPTISPLAVLGTGGGGRVAQGVGFAWRLSDGRCPEYLPSRSTDTDAVIKAPREYRKSRSSRRFDYTHSMSPFSYPHPHPYTYTSIFNPSPSAAHERSLIRCRSVRRQATRKLMSSIWWE